MSNGVDFQFNEESYKHFRRAVAGGLLAESLRGGGGG